MSTASGMVASSSTSHLPRSGSPYSSSQGQKRESVDGSEDEHEGGEADEDERKTKKQKTVPSKRACQRCRSIKTRCQSEDPVGSTSKCVRCTRLNLDCIWLEPQKRGRKIKPPAGKVEEESFSLEPTLPQPPGPSTDPLVALLAATSTPQLNFSSESYPTDSFAPPSLLPPVLQPVAFPPVASTSQQQQPPSAAYPPPPSQAPSFFASQPSNPSQAPVYASQQSLPPQASPHLHASPLNLIASPHGTNSRSAVPASYGTPGSLRSAGSPRTEQLTLPSLSMMELAEAKEAALRNLGAHGDAGPALPRSPAIAPLREPDPIDMHLLSALEAEALFEHFHTKMNAFVILLDPRLHTVDYVRRTSTCLFTSILAVSSKFLRPTLFPALLTTARQLVGRAIIDGTFSVGLIQSILLGTYYKQPSDCSSWFRIGLAIRMAYQLHLHVQRNHPLPEDELEARKILDRERVWIVLCAVDHTYHLQDEDDGFHQTCMIPHYRINVEAWLAESGDLAVADDIQQAPNFEWIKVSRLSKDLARARPAQARSLGNHLEGLLEQSYQRYVDPSSPTALEVGSRYYNKVNFFQAAATLALTGAMLIAVGTDGTTLARWVEASDAFVDAFEVIAEKGYLPYWQDTISLTLFSFGEFCVRVFSKVYPRNQTSILAWMERIYRACEVVSNGSADSTAAFISRFFRLCLRTVCSPAPSEASVSAAVMPPPHPHKGTVATPMAPNFAALASSAEMGHLQPQLSTFDPFNSTQGFSMGNIDATYWESLFPGQVTDWSFLEDQPLAL